MTGSGWFWLLMFFWVLGSGVVGYQFTPTARWGWGGWSFILFCLFVIIGLKIFGSPYHGG